MSVYDIPLHALDGSPLDASQLRGKAALIVNVASKCGLTPQYEALQSLYERYGDQGFVVVGAPCNQFGGQEPGTPEEIVSFCSSSYSVEFPLTEKLDVNGREPPSAVRAAHCASGCGRRRRGRPVELREVPRLTRR